MPSFAEINYVLRPNKNVERKLIIGSLYGLNQAFEIDQFIYIGLGSMWFVDFVLAHKVLSIEKMISIERDDYVKRASYNRPYDCIEVIGGDTTNILPELNLKNILSIIWMDYDQGLEGPVLEDTRRICGACKSGSVFITTVNSDSNRLDNVMDVSGRTLSRIEAVKHYAGDLVPPNVKAKDLKKTYFPALLGKILFDHIKVSIKESGRSDSFYPLFNIYYKDTSPMITIGGMIADDDDKKRLRDCDLPKKYDWVTGEKQFIIDVPPLTVKEKIELDQMLPRDEPPTVEEIEEAGFTLEERQIKSYHQFYRHYPVFGEFSF